MRFAVRGGMACAAAITIAVFMSWLVVRSQSPAVRRDAAGVQVVDGGTASPSPVRTAPDERAPIAAADVPADNPKRLVTSVTARFPMIREGRVECDRSCKLVLALGDQGRGPSPFNGALERYLSEQGYTLAGPLVVDQPGDNDTLLTLPLQLPMGTLRTGDISGTLPTNG